jgi:uncharacterized protein YoxC
MIIAFAVLLAIVLSTTTLLAAISSCVAIYLWRRLRRAQNHVENLTVTVYTLNTDRQVLLAQQSPLLYARQGSTLH